MKLEKFLPYQLSILSNKVSLGISKYYRDQHGITIAEWRVLALLSDTPNQTAKQLSSQSQMDKVKISRTVKALEKKKLIIEELNKKDARSKKYHLSSNGIKLFKQVKPLALEFEKRLIQSISDSDLKKFQSTIDLLYQQAEKLVKEIN